MNLSETPRIVFPDPQPRRKPTTVKHGSVTLRYYPTKRNQWILRWYDCMGKACLAVRAKREDMDQFARQKAEELSRAENIGSPLNAEAAARYRLGQERLKKINLSYGEALDIAERVSAAAARSGSSRHELLLEVEAVADRRSKTVSKTCPQLVVELLEAKRAEDAGLRWVQDLESRLNKFAADFPGAFAAVNADDVRTWLNRLNLSRRSWNNYRTALVALVAFCKDRKYLPAGWDELAGIKPFKITKGEEEIYSPKEMRAMLFTAEKHYPQHLPVLACMGFAGCRHCEFRDESDLDAPVLDWKNFHFGNNVIHVGEAVAKSNTGRRYVPIHSNLRAWLEPYVKPKGPVCTVANLSNALARIAKKAGVKWKQNGLRNSYISYRAAVTHDLAKVSREAGNSVNEVSKSYLKELTEQDGQEWFAIMPTKADVLPLFAHAANKS